METLKIPDLRALIHKNERLKPNLSTNFRFGGGCADCPREFNYLLASRCVIAEHLRLDSITDEDLLRLGPAGFVHLDLVSNVSYLAAVAEDTFFSDRLQAERVTERIKYPNRHLHSQTAVENASELVDYLQKVRNELIPPNGTFIENDNFSRLTDITEAESAIVRIKRNFSFDPWFDAQKKFARASVHNATVVNVVPYGCFVEFSDGLVGLVHHTHMYDSQVDISDQVRVEILWVDSIQKKMGLKLVEIIAEDVGDQFTPFEG